MGKIKHLIFLDFDGVMTSVENGTSFLCCNTESYHIDEQIKDRIEWILSQFPDLKIVLSTAWCNRGDINDPTPNWPWKGHNMPTPLPALYDWLSKKGMFYGTVSSERKDINGEHITKYAKIKRWIEEHEEELDKNVRIVVLDDDASDYNDLRSIDKLILRKGKIFFLQTNYEVGFSQEDCLKIYKYFNESV